ncbi:MAG: KH domain-containing protein [Eubacteriales bacterium]|nr:KH domain-containing protein [Eubacteriales bacterium]MDY3333130.1 KH domain-containing protein [Gallibacter sp.]
MTELVEFIAKALVDNEEIVEISVVEDGDVTVLQLKVAPEDMGKVIGKHGRIAKAIRTVVRAATSKTHKKVVVEII